MREPRIVPRPEHEVSRKNISSEALKVLYRIHRAGHTAYLCGGGVRDLLLGREPKDFDVVTDASPSALRKLFRNSRIIGRRFRLVHVYFQGTVVEVSTFRSPPDPERQADEDGALVTDDNRFGTPEEDAFRRDFTVNALFYDIDDFSLIDWIGGLEDMRKKLIRVIGDPELRFQEDPVRMLRACEFAGRLGFSIERKTQEGIHRVRGELEKASQARLTDEMIQLMRCGAAASAMTWMLDLGLLEVLVPEAYAFVAAGERGLSEFGKVLPTLDRAVREGEALSDIALLAALVLPSVLLRRYDVEALDQRPMRRSALARVVDDSVASFAQRFALSAARAQSIAHVLMGFHDLLQRKAPIAVQRRRIHAPHFTDSLALFEILARATGEGKDTVREWKELAAKMPPGDAPRSRRRRPRRRRPRNRGPRRTN